MPAESYHQEVSRGSSAGASHRMSRRALLGKTLAIGLAASTAGLLSACGGDEPADDAVDPIADTDDVDPEEIDDEPDDHEAPGADPQRGGSIRVATHGSPDRFDPHARIVLEEAMVNVHVYSGLVYASTDLEAAPDLAESWESNEAGDQWTFKLRSGVQFHNGREFGAQDVVESFNRILDPDLGSQYAGQVEVIDDIEVADETTVTFLLGRPYGGFPELLANDFAKIVPIEEADDLGSNPIGTGPYVLDSHSPGERTVLTRFDEFWDAENQGFVDEIHFVHMAEETARITALQSGEIDLIVDISASSVPTAEAADDVEYQEIVTGSHLTVIMVYDEEPWTDERVRTALKLCLDREAVLQVAVRGFGMTSADQPIPAIDPLYPDLQIPEQDIDRAREMLAEAGYPDGIDLELHTSPGRVGMQEIALAVQRWLSRPDSELRCAPTRSTNIGPIYGCSAHST